MRQEDDVRDLLKKYLAGNCTAKEKALLESWYLQHEEDLPEISAEAKEKQLEEVWRSLPIHKKSTRVIHWWYAAAASVLIIFGVYLFYPSKSVEVAKNDVAPGHHQATLTLANGRKIILTKGLSGKLAQQGNTTISVGNAITYSGGGEATAYNTLSTAAGEESPYPLILSDGTKVWLDAESSITYPTAFSGERLVKITGQAYFEVVHDAAHPFRIQIKNTTIEDIGTKFNVNAYEAVIRTTLLEGAVRVSEDQKSVVLRPGQVAEDLRVGEGDVEETMAWKNGYFRFNDEHIQDIMRELSRWYNIDVEYDGPVSAEGFNGAISRYKNIDQVLTMLEKTKAVQFKVEGRRVIVSE